MNRAIVATVFATICLCACARRTGSTLDAAAERYVRLALALAARDSDSLDFYAGPPGWRSQAERAYRPLADVRADLVALDRELAGGFEDRSRRRFLAGQVKALITRIDILRGLRLPLVDEASQLFGAAVPPADPGRDAMIRRELDALLPGRGDLEARYSAVARASLLPAAQIPQAFERALAACRAETTRHLALPSDERLSVEYTSTDSPWSAFTRYAGHHRSTIQINTAFAFTSADLADLACHEAYPGHHTAYVLQDDALVGTAHRIEFTIEPLFSPQSFLDEAAASYAPVLAFPDANRVSRLVGALDLERLDIARRYLDGELEFARAAAALEHDTLLPSAEPVLKFLNEFRSYVVTYTAGRDAVARIVEKSPGSDARWEAYRRLLLGGTLPAAASRP